MSFFWTEEHKKRTALWRPQMTKQKGEESAGYGYVQLLGCWERAVTSVTHKEHPSADLPWMFCQSKEGEPTMPAPIHFLLLSSMPRARLFSTCKTTA